MSIDDRNMTGCTSVLAWKFDDDQSDGIPEAEIHCPVCEKFEQADISCAGVLRWIPGNIMMMMMMMMIIQKTALLGTARILRKILER